MKVFFLVMARDASGIEKKASELDGLGYPYLIVSGEKHTHENVVYREPRGKYDAINFGLRFVPSDTDVVAFNDVDAEIHNFGAALSFFKNQSASLVFARVDVGHGPQMRFYSLLDALRKRIPVAASGELMLVKYDVLKRLLPMKGCKAEDSYILFKVLEEGEKIAFCEKSYVTTERTSLDAHEEAYKRRTVGGIYQALRMSKPPVMVRLFYALLPFAAPLLLVLGRKGYYWTKGILLGYLDCARGDKSSSWVPTYS